jgi:D-alanyl-lipoteichoic acid acyltransferase DltB (MBOAT superfamily)
MLFNSYIFIFLFLPIVLSGFFLLGKRNHRAAIAWLVACSLFFYSWWNPAYLGLMLLSMIFNYAMGAAISRHNNWHKKALLTTSVTLNLGLLAYYKYANFFVSSLNDTLGTSYHLESIVLPLAISFYTFQQIAYLVDAYRGETHEYNFMHYCLFVTFFPQLIAGPIVHHREILLQFARQDIYRVNHRNLAIGFAIFSIGLFKKIVLADGVAVFANPVFAAAESGETLSFIEAWGGGLAYTLQIYFDFSGYSDMAIGLGLLFGIRLPLNFHSPLKAVNVIELWHRWHMTLSRFLRDYLYFPLGGNRKGTGRRYLNLLITMVLGGLWHGAGWTFLIWGTMHGIGLVINHGWHSLRRLLGQDPAHSTRPGRLISVLLTFIFFTLSMVVFRAETVSGSGHILAAMFGTNGFILPGGLSAWVFPLEPWLAGIGIVFGEHAPNSLTNWGDGFTMISILLAIAWFMPNTQQVMRDFHPALDTYRGKIEVWIPQHPRFGLNVRWAVSTAFLFVIAVGALTRISEFLYFQF